jgi:hypothetical protein
MDSRHNRVGPVLEHGETARAIIAVMREANPGLEVTDRGSYLRVLVPGRCVLSRGAVEQLLGRAFVLPGDLEAVMPSFMGHMTLDDNQAVWEARGPA